MYLNIVLSVLIKIHVRHVRKVSLPSIKKVNVIVMAKISNITKNLEIVNVQIIRYTGGQRMDVGLAKKLYQIAVDV